MKNDRDKLIEALKKLSPSELQSALAVYDRDARVPETFEGFCDWIRAPISDAQREVIRVTYDGKPTTAIGEHIFGLKVGTAVPNTARAVVAGVCGGRAGKTWLLGALRLVWGALTRDLSSLQPGQRAVALAFAPRDSLRQEVINYCIGVMRSRPELERMMILPQGAGSDSSPAEFSIKRPDGKIVYFEGGVATRGGYGGRGRSLTDVLLDEVAFFRDSSYRINDEDVFKGAAPRVLPGGQAILLSTPWAQSGLLWSFYSRNFGKPQDCLTFRAPTTALNPTEWVYQMVERERMRDPENAAREFDAEFMTGNTTLFFDQELITRCIDDEMELPVYPRGGDVVRAGADFGFRTDSSALCVVHAKGPTIRVAELAELRPTKGEPLVPSQTIGAFREMLRKHGVRHVVADGTYRESVVEHLSEIGFVPRGDKPHEHYVRARTLMRDGRVRIPRHDRLIRQLSEVESRPLPSGAVSILHPRWKTGGHGDLAEAFVYAVSQLGGQFTGFGVPAKGTPERAALDEEKMIEDERRAHAAAGQGRASARFAVAPWRK